MQRTAGVIWGSWALVVIAFDVSIPITNICHGSMRHHSHYSEMNLLRDAAGSQRALPKRDWMHGRSFQRYIKVSCCTTCFAILFRGFDSYRRVVQPTTVSVLLLGNQLIANFVDEQLVLMTKSLVNNVNHLSLTAQFISINYFRWKKFHVQRRGFWVYKCIAAGKQQFILQESGNRKMSKVSAKFEYENLFSRAATNFQVSMVERWNTWEIIVKKIAGRKSRFRAEDLRLVWNFEFNKRVKLPLLMM